MKTMQIGIVQVNLKFHYLTPNNLHGSHYLTPNNLHGFKENLRLKDLRTYI